MEDDNFTSDDDAEDEYNECASSEDIESVASVRPLRTIYENAVQQSNRLRINHRDGKGFSSVNDFVPYPLTCLLMKIMMISLLIFRKELFSTFMHWATLPAMEFITQR
jgi:hypothetical protein